MTCVIDNLAHNRIVSFILEHSLVRGVIWEKTQTSVPSPLVPHAPSPLLLFCVFHYDLISRQGVRTQEILVIL